MHNRSTRWKWVVCSMPLASSSPCADKGTGGWVGSGDCLDILQNRKTSCPCWDQTPIPRPRAIILYVGQATLRTTKISPTRCCLPLTILEMQSSQETINIYLGTKREARAWFRWQMTATFRDERRKVRIEMATERNTRVSSQG
jgi:hypothetical protein